MALDKPLDLHGTGVVARYWAITGAHLDHLAGQATLWLHGWVDQAARIAGYAPLGSIALALHHAELDCRMHVADTAALYRALKAKAEAAAAAVDHDVTHAVATLGHAVFGGAGDA